MWICITIDSRTLTRESGGSSDAIGSSTLVRRVALTRRLTTFSLLRGSLLLLLDPVDRWKPLGVFDPASKNDMKMTRPEGDHAIYCNSKASTSLP